MFIEQIEDGIAFFSDSPTVKPCRHLDKLLEKQRQINEIMQKEIWNFKKGEKKMGFFKKKQDDGLMAIVSAMNTTVNGIRRNMASGDDLICLQGSILNNLHSIRDGVLKLVEWQKEAREEDVTVVSFDEDGISFKKEPKSNDSVMEILEHNHKEVFNAYTYLTDRLENIERYLVKMKKEVNSPIPDDAPFEFITDDGYVMLKNDSFVRLPAKHKLISIQAPYSDSFSISIEYKDEANNDFPGLVRIGNEKYDYREINKLFAEITRYYMRRK